VRAEEGEWKSVKPILHEIMSEVTSRNVLSSSTMLVLTHGKKCSIFTMHTIIV